MKAAEIAKKEAENRRISDSEDRKKRRANASQTIAFGSGLGVLSNSDSPHSFVIELRDFSGQAVYNIDEGKRINVCIDGPNEEKVNVSWVSNTARFLSFFSRCDLCTFSLKTSSFYH